MDACDWQPFLKAAFERNPVSVDFFRDHSLAEAARELQSWPGESIYDENRLALPDEVVNFRRGDGIEKAITLINIARARRMAYRVTTAKEVVAVSAGSERFDFPTAKTLLLPSL